MADNIALALGKTVLDGFQGAFGEGSASVNNSGITKGAANAIPLHLQPDVAAERGNLGVRLRGEWNVHPRYCVYLKDTATLKIFRSHDDSLMDKSEATLIVTIAIAKAGRHKEQNELAIRTHEGETVTCVAPSWEARRKWLERYIGDVTATRALDAATVVSERRLQKFRPK